MQRANRTVKDVFDEWALDYHADGMEKSHWLSVKQAFSLIPESSGIYLEIGFGNGYGIHYMANHQYQNGQCYGLDISPHMVEKARKKTKPLKNVHLTAGNFERWQPKNKLRFTCIFSMEVFYYFSDLRKSIEKAASLLQENGMLLVLVNYYLENPLSHSWPEDLNTPMTLWSKKEYQDTFLSCGLDTVHQTVFETGDGEGTLCTFGVKS